MKNILIISPYVPWPLNSGGNTGVFYLLQYVSQYENLYFMTLYNSRNNDSEAWNQLQQNLPKVHFLMYDYRKTQYKKYEYIRKIFRHLGMKVPFGKSKLTMDKLNYLDEITPGLIQYVNDTIDNFNIDVVEIDFLGLHPLVYALPQKVKKVFIHHELGWVRNELSYGDDFYSTFYKNFMKDNEITVLNNFDVIASMTTIDQRKLIEAGIKTKVIVSTSAINNTTFPHKQQSFQNRLTFVGGSGHYPNFDGIKWFAKKVLPIVKKHESNIRLEIIGKWSESARKEIHAIDPSVKFLGFVDDLGDGLKDSLMVVPINIGSGIRMKILEAANYSVPFVSTVVGVEGLDFEDGKECFIGKDASDMAEKIIQVIDDKNLYQQFSVNVHQKFVDNYSIESLGKKRLALFEDD